MTVDYFGSLQIVSWLLQRMLAAVYLVAFLSALEQFPALLGERGLLPAPAFIKKVSFFDAPGIFHFRYSDRFFKFVCWIGILGSAAMVLAIPDRLPWAVTTISWLVLWVIYLSIVNVGQNFYAFGWESMLLEAGFFAAFMGPVYMAAPVVPYLILRWMLFRVELGAGLIKLRHDSCWKDLTCLYYHYETQPQPNPLSWYFHRLPKVIHRTGVMFSHLVQVIVPFALFAPQPVAAIAGALIVAHQLLLIVSGNYSWLNWITVVLGLTAFSDQTLGIMTLGLQSVHGMPLSYPAFYDNGMTALLAVVFLLSIQPTLNLFSKNQLMNFSYNRLHLVNTYGAFGSMSRERFEVVVEGTLDSEVTENTLWKEYEFKAKPTSIHRMPPQVAPYHLRLDWLMWFLPFSVFGKGNRVLTFGYDRWFMQFVHKLLDADKPTLKLLRTDPFPNSQPKFIRARYYQYNFTSASARKETGAWWSRTLLGEYLPPVDLSRFERSSTSAKRSAPA
jgi:hypothetical protein